MSQVLLEHHMCHQLGLNVGSIATQGGHCVRLECMTGINQEKMTSLSIEDSCSESFQDDSAYQVITLKCGQDV